MINEVSIWTALADPKRRQIVSLLEEKPRTTSDLLQFFDVSRYAVMKHLKVLEQAQLVNTSREGRRRWNFLNDDFLNLLQSKPASDNEFHGFREILSLLSAGKQAGTQSEVRSFQYTVLLQAPPAKVYEAVTSGIDHWWSPRARVGSRVIMETSLNGRFYEAFDNDGHGVLYATATALQKDEMLRLSGSSEFIELIVGSPAPESWIRFWLSPQENSTLFSIRHDFPPGTSDRSVELLSLFWPHLIKQNLQPYLEKGICT